jgi:hypothetical protein
MGRAIDRNDCGLVVAGRVSGRFGRLRGDDEARMGRDTPSARPAMTALPESALMALGRGWGGKLRG